MCSHRGRPVAEEGQHDESSAACWLPQCRHPAPTPALREIHDKFLHRRGSRSTPEASLGTWEVRQSGRPVVERRRNYVETGRCRRPPCIHLGSPATREAQEKVRLIRGCRSIPEPFSCISGRSATAGGPESSVDRIEMLTVGCLRTKPALAGASRAHHHLHILCSYVRLTKAAPPVCNEPGFSGRFNK